MKKKISKKKIILFLMIIFFLILSIISGIKIINYIKDNHENKKIQKDIIKNSIIVEPDLKNGEENYNVDFNTLKIQNQDTIAYLKVNGTNIDYVVVRGNDNDYYLKHNFNKDYNVSGWVFADYRNKFDETDKNIVIYGHNTHDGSMFGTLKNSLNNNWQTNEENLKIVLVTERNTYYYQVFSTYTIKPEDYYIKTHFNANQEYSDFLEVIKSRSNYAYGIDVSENDKILTLSTCLGNGEKRVVLHAKLIESR